MTTTTRPAPAAPQVAPVESAPHTCGVCATFPDTEAAARARAACLNR